MRRIDGIARSASGRAAPVRRARTPDEVGRLLRPGVVVETDAATALACGAWDDGAEDEADAFEAAEDPAAFGDEEGMRDAPQ